MGKIADLYYKITRGEGKAKPYEHGPAVTLKAKCGCGGQCGCDSIESLEKSAGLTKKVSVTIVPATTDDKPSTIPADLKAHLLEEGQTKPVKTRVVKPEPKVISEVAPIVAEINKKATAPKKKPVSKSEEKRVAIQKDALDEPVAKKTPAKKPSASTAKKPAPKKK